MYLVVLVLVMLMRLCENVCSVCVSVLTGGAMLVYLVVLVLVMLMMLGENVCSVCVIVLTGGAGVPGGTGAGDAGGVGDEGGFGDACGAISEVSAIAGSDVGGVDIGDYVTIVEVLKYCDTFLHTFQIVDNGGNGTIRQG